MNTRTALPRRLLLLLPLALLGALLVGCGGSTTSADDAGESESPSESAASGEESPAEGPSPQCGEVWVDGEELPDRYGACFDGGTRVKSKSRACSFGKPLLTHEGQFWAVRGGRITESDEPDLLDDKRYRKVLAVCTA